MKLKTSSAMKLPSLVLLLMLLPPAAQAQFGYETNNGAITITVGCPSSAGAVIIPDTINGLPVTSIRDQAFYCCTNLMSITIPDSVTSIGHDAFHGCTGLTSISIPNSVTSIAYWAFSGCTGLMSITIPDSVTIIDSSAFSGSGRPEPSTGLRALLVNGSIWITGPDGSRDVIAIPASINGLPVTTIASSAFSGCTSLTSVTIPNSITRIGWSTFSGCTSLTSVTIPDSVTSIGDSAFSGCTGLTNVTIPNSVTSIGDGKEGGAFSDCTGLISVVIPNSVTNIGWFAFRGCTGLTSVSILNDGASIALSAFAFCDNLNYAKVGSGAMLLHGGSCPQGVVVIQAAVDGLPVTTLGDDIFGGCTSITSVTIPDSVTTIGDYAFWGCTGLTSAVIGNGVTTIGYAAFRDCTGLSEVYFQGNAPDVSGAFDQAPATIYYQPGTTGWGTTFWGRPTAPWVVPAPVILTAGSNLGVQANGFGFTVSWATNTPVVVEAAADLSNPTWSPVSTNTLTDGSSYFSDPQWTNSPARFYRLRSP